MPIFRGMTLPAFPDLPSETTPDGGRVYELGHGATLYVREVPPGVIPAAPDSCFRYTFLQGRKVGTSDIAGTAEGVLRIVEAWKTTMDPGYTPEPHLAPGGELAMIRPPIRDLLRRTMDEERPGSRPALDPHPHFIPLDLGELTREEDET